MRAVKDQLELFNMGGGFPSGRHAKPRPFNKKEYNKQWELKNRGKIKLRRKQHYLDNRDKMRLNKRQYYLNNKDKKKQYRLDNKDKINLHQRERLKERLKNDINFRLRRHLGSRIRIALKAQRTNKNNHTPELIGCSIEFLKRHLEKQFSEGMSWNNYGKWHIDHIYPLSRVDLIKVENQKKAFHYTNLQPLWAVENMKKGNKILELKKTLDSALKS